MKLPGDPPLRAELPLIHSITVGNQKQNSATDYLFDCQVSCGWMGFMEIWNAKANIVSGLHILILNTRNSWCSRLPCAIIFKKNILKKAFHTIACDSFALSWKNNKDIDIFYNLIVSFKTLNQLIFYFVYSACFCAPQRSHSFSSVFKKKWRQVAVAPSSTCWVETHQNIQDTFEEFQRAGTYISGIKPLIINDKFTRWVQWNSRKGMVQHIALLLRSPRWGNAKLSHFLTGCLSVTQTNNVKRTSHRPCFCRYGYIKSLISNSMEQRLEFFWTGTIISSFVTQAGQYVRYLSNCWLWKTFFKFHLYLPGTE